MQEVHTHVRFDPPPGCFTLMRCRFGMNFRFVCRWELLTLEPNPGFFPQTLQTFAKILQSLLCCHVPISA